MVRDPWLDNAKMALVTLVVLGHAWTLLPMVGVDEVLYDFLYAWHVPAFVFVTGYLSKSFAYTPTRLWQLVRTVVVPYLIFEGLLAVFRVYVGGENLERLFENPHWPMWYLAALFFWRLLTPVFRPLPGSVAVAVAVATSLVAGVWAGDTLDMARVLGLLPFFVLGLHATPERAARVFAAGRRPVAAVVLVAIGVLAVWTDRLASTEWLYYRSQYGELDVSDARAVATRAGVILVGAAGRVGVPHAGAAGQRLVHADGRLHAGRLPAARLRRPGCGVRRHQAVDRGAPRHRLRRGQPRGRRSVAAAGVASARPQAEPPRRPLRRRRARGPQGRGRHARPGGPPRYSSRHGRDPGDHEVSAGLFGLLDDVAALARLAAASVDDVAAAAGRASAKAAGVVVDDTAVTPQYVQSAAANRELPMIWRIARGSLRNKLVFILPAALLLSQFVDWALTPLLMCGGTYLCYEGAEKVWERLRGHEDHPSVATEQGELGKEDEDRMVGGAIRTDFILSAEIMVIALNEVADEAFLARAVILAAVAVGITALVYGVVAAIVKMDDIGLALSQRKSEFSQRFGLGLVKAMPALLNVISTVGVAAMLWVGGHIILVGLDDLGWHWLYDVVHHWEEDVHEALGAIGGVAGWLVNTIASAILGLGIGAVAVAVMHVLPFGHGGDHARNGEDHGEDHGSAELPGDDAVHEP